MKNSMHTSLNMVTELKMLLSQSMMLLVFTKKQPKEVQQVLWNQLNLKMKVVLLSCLPLEHTVTQLIHLSKEINTMDNSFQNSSNIHLRRFITRLLSHQSLNSLITALEINQMEKWKLLLLGMKKCLISTDSGQLMTKCSILSILHSDQWLSPILMKKLKCQSTNQQKVKRSHKFKNMLIFMEVLVFNILLSELSISYTPLLK